MKKFLALMMAATLSVTSFSTFAFAEAAEEATEEAAEPTSVELNWSDFEPVLEASGLEGEFVTFDEIAIKMWIPSALTASELTDEDKENGYIGYFADPEDENKAIAIVYIDAEGMDLEKYKELLAEDEDVAELIDGTVNGMPCISYDLPDSDSSSIAFATEAGYILEVTVAPISDEDFSLSAGIAVASIQPEDAE